MNIIRANIYFSYENEVIIAPIIKAPQGYGLVSSKYIKLNREYKKEELGEAIMEALQGSLKNESEEEGKFWVDATGIKSFSNFSKRYSCIVIICYLDEAYFKIEKWKRENSGAYGLDKDDVATHVKKYKGLPTIDLIADQVLDVLSLNE